MPPSFPVVNVRLRLGDIPTTTYAPPLGPGTTGVSPFDFPRLLPAPQTTSPIGGEEIQSGKLNEHKIETPKPLPEIEVSDVLPNPENPEKPLPRFVTREQADQAKNLTGLAVAGGALVALVAAGMLAFR